MVWRRQGGVRGPREGAVRGRCDVPGWLPGAQQTSYSFVPRAGAAPHRCDQLGVEGDGISRAPRCEIIIEACRRRSATPPGRWLLVEPMCVRVVPDFETVKLADSFRMDGAWAGRDGRGYAP